MSDPINSYILDMCSLHRNVFWDAQIFQTLPVTLNSLCCDSYTSEYYTHYTIDMLQYTVYIYICNSINTTFTSCTKWKHIVICNPTAWAGNRKSLLWYKFLIVPFSFTMLFKGKIWFIQISSSTNN